MPECRNDECECGHLRETHKHGLCMWKTCICMQFKMCTAASMFIAKGKRGFNFMISGRGMAPENTDLDDIKVYLQGILAHADQNNMKEFDYPFPDGKGKNFIFDMITRVDDYDR